MVRNRRQILKAIAVLAFSFLWFLIALGRVMRPVSLNIGADCVMGLLSTFRQGSLSGRDFQYTYGPVAQGLAWAGASLNGSAFDGFRLAILAWDITALLLLGSIVLLVSDFGPGFIALIYLLVFALDLPGWFPYSDVASFRILLAVLPVIAAGKSLASQTATGRRVWAALAGILCIIGQLTTIELGIYAAAAASLLSLAYMLRSVIVANKEALWSYLETLLTVLGIYAFGNVLISGYFYLTGEHYAFWDYQRYGIEIVRGYLYGSTWPWSFDRWQTAIMVIFIAYTLAAAWKIQRRLEPSERAVILGMTILSLLSLKTMLVRSDLNHIKAGMIPIILVFLLLGRWILPPFAGTHFDWKSAVAWITTLALLFVIWPWSHLVTPAADLFQGAGWLASPGFAQLRHSHTAPEGLLPPEVIDAVGGTDSRPMLNFPFDDHIAALLRRRQVAPVLQSFAANTIELQQYYVRSLERYRHEGDMDIIYSLDREHWWPPDRVQTISRSPIIFEYLYENFELRQHGGPMAVLGRTGTQRSADFEDLPFEAIEHNRHVAEVRLSQVTHCGLVRLEFEVDYPALAKLLKPSLIALVLGKDTARVLDAALVPLTVGRSFDTFFSVVPPEQFFKVFGRGELSAPEWNRLALFPAASDRLSISPDLRIERLSCMDSRRFVVNEEK